MVKVLGIDCSLNNLGLCVCEVDENLNLKVLKTQLIKNDQTPQGLLNYFAKPTFA